MNNKPTATEYELLALVRANEPMTKTDILYSFQREVLESCARKTLIDEIGFDLFSLSLHGVHALDQPAPTGDDPAPDDSHKAPLHVDITSSASDEFNFWTPGRLAVRDLLVSIIEQSENAQEVRRLASDYLAGVLCVKTTITQTAPMPSPPSLFPQ